MLIWLAEATQARDTFTGVPMGIHMSLETVEGLHRLACAQIAELALAELGTSLQLAIQKTATCVLWLMLKSQSVQLYAFGIASWL